MRAAVAWFTSNGAVSGRLTSRESAAANIAVIFSGGRCAALAAAIIIILFGRSNITNLLLFPNNWGQAHH